MKQSDCKNRLPQFKERFTELRGNMSNTEFADFLGMSRQTVGFYINGQRIPDILGLYQISEKCNVSADWLVGLTNVKDVNLDVKSICEKTGLSEQATQILLMSRKYTATSAVLSAFIEDPYFLAICANLSSLAVTVAEAKEYEVSTQYNCEDVDQRNPFSDSVVLHGYDLCEFHYQLYSKDLDKIVERLTGIDVLREYVRAKREEGYRKYTTEWLSAQNLEKQ